jgi:hypothetical protein
MHPNIHVGEHISDKWYMNVRENRNGKLEWTIRQNLEQDTEHKQFKDHNTEREHHQKN